MIFREIEDRDLIPRACDGDVDAYNVLVSRWEKKIYNYLLKSVGNREDALDLSQETFLKAYRGLAKLADLERFPQWLFRIARNETISHYRRGRMEYSDVDPGEGSAETTGPSRSLVNRADLTVAVEQALRTLPDEQREAVVLKVYYGFKFHEIAEITDTPLSTVKSRVYTGFETLQEALAPARRGWAT